MFCFSLSHLCCCQLDNKEYSLTTWDQNEVGKSEENVSARETKWWGAFWKECWSWRIKNDKRKVEDKRGRRRNERTQRYPCLTSFFPLLTQVLSQWNHMNSFFRNVSWRVISDLSALHEVPFVLSAFVKTALVNNSGSWWAERSWHCWAGFEPATPTSTSVAHRQL